MTIAVAERFIDFEAAVTTLQESGDARPRSASVMMSDTEICDVSVFHDNVLSRAHESIEKAERRECALRFMNGVLDNQQRSL